MAARRLRLAVPQARITVVERAPVFGGLLAGRIYESNGLYFDQGTHIFQETGLPEIDDFLQQSIGADNLILFPPGQGDSAGIVFNGSLQIHTHFPDLRNHPEAGWLIEDLRRHIQSSGGIPDVDRLASLGEVATSRFGIQYARGVLLPMLERAYGLPVDRLAGFALLLPGLSRVVIDDGNAWSVHKNDARYRAVVGFPDQIRLPAQYRHGRRSFYARRNGSRALVDGVAAWLAQAGVRMLSSTSIAALDLSSLKLTLQGAGGDISEIHADGIVLSTGPIGAAQLLGVGLESFGFERPMPHWIVNMQFRESTTTDLCYAYGMDASCDWYRCTNYRGFSGDSMDRRVTLEVLGDRLPDPAGAIDALAMQLKASGLIQQADLEFSDAFRLPAGFPVPTIRNLKAMTDLAEQLNAKLPSNVILAGIGSRKGLFFQNEVVSDIYDRAGTLA